MATLERVTRKVCNLVPIKGIDEARVKALREYGIIDTTDLLKYGRSKTCREDIAHKILLSELKDYENLSASDKNKYEQGETI